MYYLTADVALSVYVLAGKCLCKEEVPVVYFRLFRYKVVHSFYQNVLRSLLDVKCFSR